MRVETYVYPPKANMNDNFCHELSTVTSLQLLDYSDVEGFEAIGELDNGFWRYRGVG